jgi:large subunit ribosomal protein L28e
MLSSSSASKPVVSNSPATLSISQTSTPASTKVSSTLRYICPLGTTFLPLADQRVHERTITRANSLRSKAIGVTPHPEGGLVVKTKDASSIQKPASAVSATEFKGTFPLRKAYATIVDSTTKKGYRSDLRAEAVARASAIKMSQRAKKDLPARKARGKKAIGGVEAQE